MGSWWRSREMKYVSLIVSEDAAHECVTSLGELGALQLTDLNPELTAFQRRYVGYMKRCDELERKLRYMEKEVSGFGLVSGSGGPGGPRLKGAALLDALEGELERYEGELVELTNYATELTARYNEKIEYQECLEKSAALFAEATRGTTTAATTTTNPLAGGGEEPLLTEDAAESGAMMRFSSSVGVVGAADRARFERMLFRSSRGNCLVRFAEVERPLANKEPKLVFIVFYKSEVIGQLVDRVCAAFGARQYAVPGRSGLEAALDETRGELADAREVLLKNRELRLALCAKLAERLSGWRGSVAREKAVYHALNMFKADVSGVLRAEGWIVADAESEARALVTRAHAAVDLAGAAMLAPVAGPWPTPPTYFETNAFTEAYQQFVDTYGVPRYREINPALFTAITFPFLFGMMYGDVGHGSVVALFGFLLLARGHRSPDSPDPLDSLALGRYMITMMGLAAVYCGLVYNDCFAVPLDLFGSTYEWKNTSHAYRPETGEVATRTSDEPYPFGVDPAWHVSQNELLFFNSMKMKTAVIVGIAQMTGGILLKGVNDLYFGDFVAFTLEFLPMIIFDLALFGYMVILIFTKWAIDWDDRMLKGTCRLVDQAYKMYPFDDSADACTPDGELAKRCALDFGGTSGGCAPPNLINQLINIALNPGSVDEPMYQNQDKVQTFLLVLAFLCVPVLLLGRPAYVYFKHHHDHPPVDAAAHHIEMHHAAAGATSDDDDDGADLFAAGPTPLDTTHDDDDAEEHSFTEVLIHQAIETIEFVLGMVSNTASYLRLWALSLAHSELAQVFWEDSLRFALNKDSAVVIFVAYAFFAFATFAVLLAMDLLECFLHALRLHWVEFQSKFYKADGYKFTPFAFAAAAAKR